MRLIKRTQPEKGMVCRLKENGEVLIDDFKAGTTILWNENCPYENKDLEIIGKTGHNYSLKNGKLVKIKLPDVSADDVFEGDETILFLIEEISDSFNCECTHFENIKRKYRGNLHVDWFAKKNKTHRLTFMEP